MTTKYVMHRTRDGVAVPCPRNLGDSPAQAIVQFARVHDSIERHPGVERVEWSEPCEGQPTWAYSMTFMWDGSRWNYWVDESCDTYSVRWES